MKPATRSGMGPAIASRSRPTRRTVPGVAPDQSEQDAHQRGFAGTVRAEESVQLAGPRDEIDVTKGVAAPEALRHTGSLDGRPSDHRAS